MDENRNPFDSTQPNSNPSEPTQTGTHNTPSTKHPQQEAYGQSENIYYQAGQEYRNTEQNQQTRSSDIPPYQWNSSYQGDMSQNQGTSGQQTPRGSYGQQYPYGTEQPNSWNQNDSADSFPDWNGQYWQNGAGFQPSPFGWPPQEPKKKMSVGMKVFIVILAVLAVSFIGGFTGFGIYVVVQQQNGTSSESSDNYNSSQSSNNSIVDEDAAANVPDKTDPNFQGITLSSVDSEILTPEQVYEKVSVSMVSILATSIGSTTESGSSVSQGSGVIATSNGYIITNAHVINYSKSAQVAVITHDQKQYDGVVVGLDKDADLAVIKIEAEGLIPAEFGDDNDLSVGETVAAIGNPGGVQYSGSMTMGVVSAVNRSVANYSSTGITYIQTDTAINPGNSGGGLINMRGQVVGINTIKVVSSGYEGMGFSIPISQAKPILDTLIREGDIPSVGKLGITGSTKYLPVDGENYSIAGGVFIASIDSSSPLTDSDLEQGDLIVAFNGNTIKTLEDVYTQLKDYRVGEDVTLTIRRINENEDFTFDVQTTIMNRN